MSISPFHKRHLERLKTWLTFGGSGMAAGTLGFFLLQQLLLALIFFLMVIFTPILIYSLYKIQKTNWIIWFVVLVGLPLLLFFFTPPSSLASWFTLSLGMVSYFLYCWILRHQVIEWLEEIRWLQEQGIVDNAS